MNHGDISHYSSIPLLFLSHASSSLFCGCGNLAGYFLLSKGLSLNPSLVIVHGQEGASKHLFSVPLGNFSQHCKSCGGSVRAVSPKASVTVSTYFQLHVVHAGAVLFLTVEKNHFQCVSP